MTLKSLSEPEDDKPMSIHASCVQLNRRGVLILGASGAGKSSLAWALIAHHGALLVGDDRLVLSAEAGTLTARPRLPGRIEMWGVGVIQRPYCDCASLDLVVDLDRAAMRVAEPEYFEHAGLRLPVLGLSPQNAQAALRVVVALRTIGRTGFSEIGEYEDEI